MRRRYLWVLLTAWLVSLFVAPPAEAGMFAKLARGAANTLTGILEVPFQITQTTEREGSLAGLSVGVVRGVARALKRTLIGVYEAVTFPLPNYPVGEKDSYAPILEPEFVIYRQADKS